MSAYNLLLRNISALARLDHVLMYSFLNWLQFFFFFFFGGPNPWSLGSEAF
jgi:hypothetical protein